VSSIDRHANRDLLPPRKLAEPAQSPVDLLLLAAGLLDRHGAASSECRSTADRLRQLVKRLAVAERAAQVFGRSR